VASKSLTRLTILAPMLLPATVKNIAVKAHKIAVERAANSPILD